MGLPISCKSNVLSIYKKFQVYVECYFETNIKSVQSDWGGEYRSLNKYLNEQGITHHISCPHTHQQNEAIERKHQHIVKTGLALLSHAHLSSSFWADAFQTSCYLINRMSTPLLPNKSPFEVLFQTQPDYSFLRVFGCACWPNLCPYNANKLQSRSLECIFFGYRPFHKGYKCFHVSSSRVYISRDKTSSMNPNFHLPSCLSLPHSLIRLKIVFYRVPSLFLHVITCGPHPGASTSAPSSPPSSPLVSPSASNSLDHTCAHQADTFSSQSNIPSTHPLPLTNSIPPEAPISHHPVTTRSKNHISMPKHFTDGSVKYPLPHALLVAVNLEITEPTCYSIAIKDENWRQAMNHEFDALLNNQTWCLVSPNSAQNLIGCKWVFWLKRKADGSIERYKSWLVAKGFHRQPG